MFVCEADNPHIIEELTPGSDINAVDNWGQAPLHCSAQNEWVEMT